MHYLKTRHRREIATVHILLALALVFATGAAQAQSPAAPTDGKWARDPHTQNCGASELHIAAYNGDVERVGKLLQGGAEVDARFKERIAGHQCPFPFASTPLFLAASEGQVGVMRLLLAHGADPKTEVGSITRDTYGSTPLHAAASFAAPDALKLLLEHGCKVATTDSAGRTPLHAAACSGALATARFLLAAGADVSAKDKLDFTPLHAATAAKDPAMLKLLLQHGAELRALGFEGRTALHLAAMFGRAANVEFLLGLGLSPKAVDESQRTALFFAENRETVDLLLKAGLRTDARDKNGMTPLIHAAYENNRDGVVALLEQGADITARTPGGLLALHETSSIEVAKVLLAKRPQDINARGPDSGRTALHYQAGAVSSMSLRPDLLKFLIASGADVNATNNIGETPIFLMLLHSDIPERREEGLRSLLEAGAKVDVRGKNGRTPLHAAAVADCRANEIDLLMRAGAQVNATDDEGRTPLMLAAIGSYKGHSMHSLRALLAHKANVSLTDAQGRTALHLAVIEGRRDAVKLLFDHGADAKARDKEGRTPTDLAQAARWDPFFYGPGGKIARGPQGTLPRSTMQRVERKHRKEIKACYEAGRKLNPNLHGTVTLRIGVGPRGRVNSLRVESSSLDNHQTVRCLLEAILRWKFPRPKNGADAAIVYPFVFKPGK